MALTPEELEDLNKVQAMYEQAIADDDEEFAEELLNQYPGMFNYDERGNWLGNMKGE